MKLHLIAAHDDNLVIGNKGKLPWRLPEDLKHFKSITMGHPILMGRGVFEEIGEKPLPGRRNVVLSRKVWNHVESYSRIDDALTALSEEDVVFLIGGGQIYDQMIEMCDKMYITEVKGSFDGDVFFPEYRAQIGKKWIEVNRDNYPTHSFVEYIRSSV
jgi:dihydrofolate reductase